MKSICEILVCVANSYVVAAVTVTSVVIDTTAMMANNHVIVKITAVLVMQHDELSPMEIEYCSGNDSTTNKANRRIRRQRKHFLN